MKQKSKNKGREFNKNDCDNSTSVQQMNEGNEYEDLIEDEEL